MSNLNERHLLVDLDLFSLVFNNLVLIPLSVPSPKITTFCFVNGEASF